MSIASKLKRLLVAFLVLFLLIAGAAGVGYFWLDRNVLSALPTDLSRLRTWRPPTSCLVHDKDGVEIDEFYIERRIWVPIDEIPAVVWQAFLAAEDRRFFDHPGVDLLGIARAFVTNFRSGTTRQGGSTITQQLVKNLLVGREKSYRRKMREVVLAQRLEAELSKKEILELYVNFIYLGAGNYGVEAAAQDYFGISARELNAGQAALLAGLVPAPSRYNPRRYPETAKLRREIVLVAMVETGYVDAASAARFAADPATSHRLDGPKGAGVAYLTQTRREIRHHFGADFATQAGLRVYTPYSSEIQALAEVAVREAVEAASTRRAARGETRPVQGAAIVAENATGHVIALVGGYDFTLEGFVRATQARRQPGSAFKPFVYAAALDAGKSALDVVPDVPISLPGAAGTRWTPKNYDGKFSGPQTLRTALARSVNTIAVRLLLEVGVDRVISTSRVMGIRTPLRRDPTIALGSSEVSLLDLVRGYMTIARMGVPIEPVFVREVLDGEGGLVARAGETIRVLPDQAPLPGAPLPRALGAGVAYELADTLREVVRAGTARKANKPGFDRAGKTGTTSDYIDAWFIGFTPRHTVGVWIGTDSVGSLGEGETGGRAALPAWIKIVDGLPEVAGERLPIPDEAALIGVGNPGSEHWIGLRRGTLGRAALFHAPLTAEPLPIVTATVTARGPEPLPPSLVIPPPPESEVGPEPPDAGEAPP